MSTYYTIEFLDDDGWHIQDDAIWYDLNSAMTAIFNFARDMPKRRWRLRINVVVTLKEFN